MDLSPDKKDVPQSERPIEAAFAPLPSGTGAGPGPEAGGTRAQVPMQEKLPDDPWKNRSKTMRCMTCMFFVFKRPDELGGMLTNGFLGRCRRHSPTMNGYPAVFELDWCGDHKIDENKI
jgi:hypothetical protein